MPKILGYFNSVMSEGEFKLKQDSMGEEQKSFIRIKMGRFSYLSQDK